MGYFEFVHNLGIHSWDIPALIALVIVHHNNQKKRDDDFEKDLDDKIQEIREGQNLEENQTFENDQTAEI